MFGVIIGAFTFVSLGADGTITIGYLNNSGTALPINVSIYPAYYIVVMITIMDLLLAIVKGVRG